MGRNGHQIRSVNAFQMPTMFSARLDVAGDAKVNKSCSLPSDLTAR